MRGYKEYSRTASGGIIYENPKAPPAERWRIEHPHYGNRFFAEHDEIMEWVGEQMAKYYRQLLQPSRPRGGDDTDGQHRP